MERLYIHCNAGELTVETIGPTLFNWPQPNASLVIPPAPPETAAVYFLTWPVPNPTTVVIIPHGMGHAPAGITVLDAQGFTHSPRISYPDSNTLRLEFIEPFQGTIYLS